jgi:polysaccharide export outer membrane protein
MLKNLGTPCLLLTIALAGAPATVAWGQESVSQTAPVEELAGYSINPGDELQIHVWGEERLQRSVKVAPDGTVALPLIGQMMVKGNEPRDLEERITERLKGQYRGKVPQVTVSVAKSAGLQFTVMGKVNSPGVFSPGRYVTIVEALALAGGTAPYANLKDIVVMRKEGDGHQVIRVNVKRILKGRGNAADLKGLEALQTGDTIIVR